MSEPTAEQFLERLYAATDLTAWDANLNGMDWIDATMSSGQFERVDAILSQADAGRLRLDSALGLLTITHVAQQHLPSYRRFFGRTFARCAKEGWDGSENADSTFQGLYPALDRAGILATLYAATDEGSYGNAGLAYAEAVDDAMTYRDFDSVDALLRETDTDRMHVTVLVIMLTFTFAGSANLREYGSFLERVRAKSVAERGEEFARKNLQGLEPRTH